MWLADISGGVFALDRGTGLPHVQHLYYIPIIFAATRLGAFGGATAAVLAIALYHLANPHALTWRYEESDLPTLPEVLEYRLVNRDLLLIDVGSDLVVDVLHGAV